MALHDTNRPQGRYDWLWQKGIEPNDELTKVIDAVTSKMCVQPNDRAVVIEGLREVGMTLHNQGTNVEEIANVLKCFKAYR